MFINAILKLNKIINDSISIKYLIDSIIFSFGHDRYDYDPIDPSSHRTGRILNHTHNFTTDYHLMRSHGTHETGRIQTQLTLGIPV
jgi:hypothetical protein